MRLRLFHLTILAAVAVGALGGGAGCIYAPIDFGLGELGKMQELTVVESDAAEKVLLVKVDGEITDYGQSTLFSSSEATTASVREQLDIARKDENVRAVIVRINSPGGGVTASDIVYRELMRFKTDTKRAVVALFMDVAASGGYYIAQAADEIVAHPTTLTGSIGVIALLPDLKGLLEKIGVEVHTFKSGKNKDLGNIFRHMEEEERRLIQSIVDKMYGQFFEVVRKGRPFIPSERLKVLADGRVFLAEEALKEKLIDRVGYFDDALEAAKRHAGIAEARVVTYERKGFGVSSRTVYSSELVETALDRARLLPGGRGGGGAGDVNLLKVGGGADSVFPRGGPVFKYLWVPGD